MKHLIYFLILIFTYSCNQNNRTDSNLKTDLNVKTNQIKTDTVANLEQKSEDLIQDTSDCIFDQLTQTDEFLKGINELNGYKWDYKTRTATIILQNQDTLFITRGGCYDFGVSAEFRLRFDTTDYSEWKNVFKKVLWIAKVLDNEFSYQEIKNEIDSSKIVIENSDFGDIIGFSSEHLQDSHYEISRKIEKDYTVITISYYIN